MSSLRQNQHPGQPSIREEDEARRQVISELMAKGFKIFGVFRDPSRPTDNSPPSYTTRYDPRYAAEFDKTKADLEAKNQEVVEEPPTFEIAEEWGGYNPLDPQVVLLMYLPNDSELSSHQNQANTEA